MTTPQTTIIACWWCGEPSVGEVEVEPPRMFTRTVGGQIEKGVIAARRAWACATHMDDVRGAPVKPPRNVNYADPKTGKPWRP